MGTKTLQAAARRLADQYINPDNPGVVGPVPRCLRACADEIDRLLGELDNEKCDAVYQKERADRLQGERDEAKERVAFLEASHAAVERCYADAQRKLNVAARERDEARDECTRLRRVIHGDEPPRCGCQGGIYACDGDCDCAADAAGEDSR